MRENIAKLWLTNNLLGREERELLFCHQRMNHCTFKNLIRFYKRGKTPPKTSKLINTPPCDLNI